MKAILSLLLIASCASAPKKEAITNFSQSHPSCQIKAEDLDLTVFKTSSNGITRGMKTSGSLIFTTVGYLTDVVVISASVIGLAYLCGDHFAVDCVDATDMFEGGYTGIGNWTFDKTERWRCPYVDHISEAVRESAECNYKKNHYIEAFEQMNFLARNDVMKTCSSDLERQKFQTQMESMKRP